MLYLDESLEKIGITSPFIMTPELTKNEFYVTGMAVVN